MAAKTFDQLYKGVPAEKREMLRTFRAAHPYQHATVNGVTWDYIVSGQGQQALLILGGGGSVGESSYARISHLEQRFRVISPSYPSLSSIEPGGGRTG